MVVALAAAGARAAPRRDRDARPGLGHDRRVAAVGGGLLRRLGSGLRHDAPHLRRGRRRLAGHLRPSCRRLRVQGCAQQRLGRELRPPRGPERRQHPDEPRLGRERQVLLRPQDPLGDRQQELRDRDRRRQLPVGARLPGRLGSRLPALVARGPGRQRHLLVRDDGAAGGLVRDEGDDQRGLGPRTTASAAP